MDFYSLWALYAIKFYNAITIGEKRKKEGQKEGQCKNVYERFNEGTLPEEIQRQAESNAEYLFRAGFFVGKKIKEILENTEGTDENGEAD